MIKVDVCPLLCDGVMKLYGDLFFIISQRYNLDYAELMALANQKPAKCARPRCKAIPFKNGYCAKHQGELTATTTAPRKQRAKKKSIETAVPQEPTKLKRLEDGTGYISLEGDYLFDLLFKVIGIKGTAGIGKLSALQVEVCEQRGWHYEKSAIDDA